jgi:hypothetical protein
MGTTGTTETFFVVASTDLQRSGAMTTRIREQLERVDELQSKGTLTITTFPVEYSSGNPDATLEQQVQSVAGCVTQMILTSREQRKACSAKSTQVSNSVKP